MGNTQTDNNSIINAVKRLERAGSANSVATQKLCDAAIRTFNFLYDTVPDGFFGTVKLTDGQTVEVAQSYHESEHRDLYAGYDLRIEGVGYWRRNGWELKPDEKYRDVERWEALRLAELLASGFLAALESEIQADTETTEAATSQIEKTV